MVYWHEYAFDYYLCKNCGARFANPMPGNDIIAKGNDALVRFYQKDRSFDDEFRDARQAFLRGKLLGKKLKRWKKNGKLLEVGTYNGFFLAGIKETSGWEVEGVEIASSLVIFARDKLGLNIHAGVLEEVALRENDYDFVVFNDLIEHITQPSVFLAKVFSVLKPGGRMQLITPNASQDTAFAKRAYDLGTPLHIILNHIMFFTPKALRLAAESAGFTIKSLYCFDIAHVLKDYGVFGLGKVGKIEKGPSFSDSEGIKLRDFTKEWSPAKIDELKKHPKVSLGYGFFKEILPKAFTLKIPEALSIGHEIYALAEKPIKQLQ